MKKILFCIMCIFYSSIAMADICYDISEKVADFPITISGMLAASHKEGGPMTAKYLKSLEKNKDGLYYLPYHKYKGNTLRSFLAIETRLREFSELNTDN